MQSDLRAQGDGETSLFALGAILLRNRWRIARWAFGGAVIAATIATLRPVVYVASTSFVTQGTDAARSGLLSLAGQFGVTLPIGDASRSPAFYAALLRSRVLLLPIVRDTFEVTELGGVRHSFMDLFGVSDQALPQREERALIEADRLVRVSVANATGTVHVSVTTRWPSVSLAIVTALLDGLNAFNRLTRQTEAGAERTFVDERLKVAGAELQAAEDNLARFLASNRQFAHSPDLTFQHERLQRAVLLQSQVYTSLKQAYEQARIREVRDTPVITVVEPPLLPSLHAPRRRVWSAILGLFLGGLTSVVLAFTAGMMELRGRAGGSDYQDFVGALQEARTDLLRPFRRFTTRQGR